MTDEVTSGFTSIEEDASTATDPEQHLKIEIVDFLGGSDTGLNSYVNLGKWTPSATAGTVSSDELAAAATDGSGNPTYTKDTSTGDDLLAAFILNTYVDDTRDRNDAAVSSDNRAKPGVDYTKFAQPPRITGVRDAASLTDGTDLFPASADDTTGHYYYSQAARQAVTKKIPKYVGWRDHTEGHRITTTRGDKIEIVGGNYKLISLGRGGGTVHTEWSGGHVIDTLEAPGNVTSINWRAVPSVDDEPGWQWVEETVKGNVIERYHGSMRTEHYGDEVISIVGRSDEDDTIATVTDSAESADQAGTFDDVTEDAEEDNRWDARDGAVPATRPQPKVVSNTWGMWEYDETHATGHLIDIDHADEIHDFLGCEPELNDDGTVKTTSTSWILFSKSDAAFKTVVTHSDCWGDRPDLIREYVVADQLRTTIKANNIFQRRDCALYVSYKAGTDEGSFVNPIVASEEWEGHVMEMFVGAKVQTFLAAYVTLEASHVEIFLGAEVQLNGLFLVETRLACIKGSLVKHTKGKLVDEEQRLVDAQAKLNKARATLVEYEKMGFGFTAAANVMQS
jgi:hypothetical protein